MKRFVVILILSFAVSGCASIWYPVKESTQPPGVGYRVELPEGWLKLDSIMSKRLTDPLDRGVIITRDGMMLQRINVGFMELGEDLLSTDKRLNDGLLPQEAAEVVVDNFRMAQGVLEFNVLENIPTDLGGHPGFKVLLEYKVDSRLWRRRMFYGAIVEDRFYFLQYRAPRRYYFERDLGTFQSVVDSFRPIITSVQS